MKVDLKLSGKTLVAGLAVFLGAVLAMAATITRGTDAGPVNAPALAQNIVKEKGQVTAGELALWIVEKRGDYQLIDLRDPWEFDDYHIPTAVNIPLRELFEAAGLKKLARGKKIVVYGLGAGNAAKAQLLLDLKGYSAYALPEGIIGWWGDVMTPLSLRSANPTPTGYRQAKQLREHFLGITPAAGTSTQVPPAFPVTPPPAAKPSPAAPADKTKLKLGRGCS